MPPSSLQTPANRREPFVSLKNLREFTLLIVYSLRSSSKATKFRREDSWSERQCRVAWLASAIRNPRSQQHEAQIGLRRHDTSSEQLREPAWRGSPGPARPGQSWPRFFGFFQQVPSCVIDPEKKMDTCRPSGNGITNVSMAVFDHSLMTFAYDEENFLARRRNATNSGLRRFTLPTNRKHSPPAPFNGCAQREVLACPAPHVGRTH